MSQNNENREVPPEPREVYREVRSESPLHEACHRQFQTLAEDSDLTFTVEGEKAVCDYDELVDHIVLMAGKLAAEING